jgi:hypothetical protein
MTFVFLGWCSKSYENLVYVLCFLLKINWRSITQKMGVKLFPQAYQVKSMGNQNIRLNNISILESHFAN